MVCPKCKNKNFVRSSDFKKPVLQYKTDKYPHANYRRYICLQCEHKWETIEKYDRTIEVRKKINA